MKSKSFLNKLILPNQVAVKYRDAVAEKVVFKITAGTARCISTKTEYMEYSIRIMDKKIS